MYSGNTGTHTAYVQEISHRLHACFWVLVHIYHISMHTCTCTRTHARTHARTHTQNTHTCTHTHTRTHTHANTPNNRLTWSSNSGLAGPFKLHCLICYAPRFKVSWRSHSNLLLEFCGVCMLVISTVSVFCRSACASAGGEQSGNHTYIHSRAKIFLCHATKKT